MEDVLVPRRRVSVAVALAAALAATLVVSVTPAGARNTRATAVGLYCNPVATQGAELFDSLAKLGPAATTARGNIERERSLGQAHAHAPKTANAKPSSSITIPTWMHVVSPDGVVGNVSDKAIRAQLQVFNLAYAGFYGGAATPFRFELAGVTRSVNEAWYLVETQAAEDEMKQTLKQGGADTLNVYINTAGANLGWAYYPSVVGTSFEYLDGIVLDWESMPGTSSRYAGQYDLGHTLTHEAGHWLNLAHTFDGGCSAGGDGVDDTPSERTPTSGCPEGKDTCVGKPGLDPIHNYLDYSFDACYSEFTPGQNSRMFDAWSFWRA
jgi:hypothetical protein